MANHLFEIAHSARPQAPKIAVLLRDTFKRPAKEAVFYQKCGRQRRQRLGVWHALPGFQLMNELTRRTDAFAELGRSRIRRRLNGIHTKALITATRRRGAQARADHDRSAPVEDSLTAYSLKYASVSRVGALGCRDERGDIVVKLLEHGWRQVRHVAGAVVGILNVALQLRWNLQVMHFI